MIICSVKRGREYQEIRGREGDRVEVLDYFDDKKDTQFRISRNGNLLLSLYGSHSRELLHAFLRQGSTRHLKAFKLGIEDELEYRENKNAKTKNHA